MNVSLSGKVSLDLSPDSLRAEVREHFGAELRRLGVFTQLCQLGAERCLEAAGGVPARLGVLVGTAHGARSAVLAALDEGLARGEPVMPFTFIATQTSLAGALFARRQPGIVRSACFYFAQENWNALADLAGAWLAGGCGGVLVGWVEESCAPGEPHRARWALATPSA